MIRTKEMMIFGISLKVWPNQFVYCQLNGQNTQIWMGNIPGCRWSSECLVPVKIVGPCGWTSDRTTE